MISSIIYTSNSGFTKKYAEMLGEEAGLPVYNLKEADTKVNKSDEIIYMGWIMVGGIKNYRKAKKLYNIKATCAIGMALPDEKQYNEILERHHIKEKLFYMQGGYDKSKLSGIYKFMMNSVEKITISKLEQKIDKTNDEVIMLDMMKNGKDCVKKENLSQIIEWVNTNK